MSYAREQSSGDMSRNFVGGTAQTVNDGADARDGQLFLFVSADWAGKDLKPPKVLVKKGVTIPVHLEVMENLLMCSCVIVMCGKQCGPLHLALVAHCREFLWKNTPSSVSRRMVEGSGMVDYLQIMWAIDSDLKLYRSVTSSVGLCEHVAANGSRWDAFWYMYRRGDNTPAYSHIGLDTSATLNKQSHVADRIREAIDAVPVIMEGLPSPGSGKTRSTSIFGSWFSRRNSTEQR